MFQDLDATLTALVQAELSLNNVAISFAGPDDQFPPSGVTLPAIAFFLYDVRVNKDLRTTDWDTDRHPNGLVTRTRQPARVDCSYLITAWPSDSAPNPIGDEHRLLGEVLKVLLRNRRIPERHLRGDLIDQQQPPVYAKVIDEGRLSTLGEFWQAMGGRPKATLHYALTLSVDVFDAHPVGPEVTDRVTGIRSGGAS